MEMTKPWKTLTGTISYLKDVILYFVYFFNLLLCVHVVKNIIYV